MSASPANSANSTEPVKAPAIAIIPVSSNMGFPSLLNLTHPSLAYRCSSCGADGRILCGWYFAKDSGNLSVRLGTNLDLISHLDLSKKLFEIGAVHANATVRSRLAD
jgi:hypothetical protein